MSNRIEQGTSETRPSSTPSLRERRNRAGRFFGTGILVGAVALGILVDRLITSSPSSIPVLSARDGTILRGTGTEDIEVTVQSGQSAPVLFQARGMAGLRADTDSASPGLETSISVGNDHSGKALSDIQSLEAVNTGAGSYKMQGQVDTYGKDTTWAVQVPFGDQAKIVEKS